MKEEKWICDFCKKAELSISSRGLIYCRNCKKSYEETIYDLARKLIKDKQK